MRTNVSARIRRLGTLAFAVMLVGTTTLAQTPTRTLDPARIDALRFLEQSSFGPTPENLQRVMELGIPAYIDEQVSLPGTPYPQFQPYTFPRPDDCTGDCARDNYSLYQLQKHFFQNALTGQDQLRQRMAFALSQIFVVSANDSSIALPDRIRDYEQMLYDDAFANYRKLLTDVTLSPTMGAYLNMVNNKRQTSANAPKPNENYARELLQLFTTGLYQLNDDGTRKLDANGNPIPVYTQATIEEFARVFTGYTYAKAFPSANGGATTAPNYTDQMVVRLVNGNDPDHDKGAKRLLDGTVLPAGQSTAKDVSDALDNIFKNANVPPFVCTRLIQSLVTSNPSPGYVSRVVAVFKDNGKGARGDLAAVVKAILLDPEARGTRPDDPNFGKLREPALFITRVLRAVGATSDGVLNDYSAAFGQDVFRSPSVFNYYQFTYQLPGSNLLGPEFQIYNNTTAVRRVNFISQVVYQGVPAGGNRPLGTKLNLAQFVPLAVDPSMLVVELDRRLMNGEMPDSMRQEIADAVAAIPAGSPLQRVQSAVFLIASSPEFQIER